jgi:hypothetical protein
MGSSQVCSFCTRAAPRAVSGRRAGATLRVVCAACLDALELTKVDACDFCDHASGGSATAPAGAGDARARDVSICGDCLAFARQVLHTEEGEPEAQANDEARFDAEQLWSDLTPAPRPDVDPDAPATAYADLAIAFFEMGLVDDAREQVAKALELDPRHPEALRLIEKLPPPR